MNDRNWISCNERRPKESGYYLVTYQKDSESLKKVDCASFEYSSGRWSWWCNRDVIAWMPLPEPYKE